MAIGDDALDAGFALVPETGEAGRVRYGAREINRTRDYIAQGPQGEVGYAQVTTVSSNFIVANSTEYDLPGLTTTVTLIQGRKYKVTLKVEINTNSTSDGGNRLAALITSGANAHLGSGGYIYPTNAGYGVTGLVVARYVAATDGAFTFKGRIYRAVAVGAQKIQATTDYPSYILVEDMGA